MKMNEVQIATLVDTLGAVKAVIAEQKTVEEGLKADLIGAAAESGLGAFEGALYRATVSFTNRKTVDKDAVIADLAELAGLTPKKLAALVDKHTKLAEGLPMVRVSARKGA